jgi:hypothetical protein
MRTKASPSFGEGRGLSTTANFPGFSQRSARIFRLHSNEKIKKEGRGRPSFVSST